MCPYVFDNACRDHGQELKAIYFKDLFRVLFPDSLVLFFFADDVVLLASSVHDLLHALGCFTVARIKISSSKSDAMIFNMKNLDFSICLESGLA